MAERATPPRLRRSLVACLLAGMAAAIACFSPVISALDRLVLDSATTRAPSEIANETLLVTIDDKSMVRFGRWPWPRAVHAEMIRLLSDAGASTIALDVMLAEPDLENPASDAALATAIARSGRVLLPVPTVDGASGLPARMAALWPAARFVHSNIPYDEDGKARSVFRWMESGDISLPALPLALRNPQLAVSSTDLKQLGPEVGARWTATDPMLVAPLANPERLHRYSYSDVLDGRVPADIFRGHQVLIGTTAAGLVRPFLIPGARITDAVTGAELNASLANQISVSTGIEPATPRNRMTIVVLVAMLAVLGASLTRWPLLLAWLLGGAAIAIAGQWAAVHNNAWWVGTSPVLFGVLIGGFSLLVSGGIDARLRSRELAGEAKQLATELADTVNALDLDALTGLSTRRFLSTELERRAARPMERGSVLAIVALDGFKRVNEALGYGDGDAVLREVAGRLRQMSPAPLLLARWSGDQFAALLDATGHDDNDLDMVAAEFHRAVSGKPLKSGDLHLSASVAVSACEHGLERSLVKQAERALLDVKRSGGGRWVVAREQHSGWTRETLALEQDLRHALVDREFFMVYQPVMDVASGRFASMEALLRWQHPQRGLLTPGAFLQLAEELGLEVQLGELAFELVHADMGKLAEQGLRLPVAVNVSTRHFERGDFTSQLASSPLVRDCGRGMVRIEVTESMALSDPARAASQVVALETAGVGVALDDFGCGHSSLALLRSLRVQQVKIDRSFVQDAMFDAGAQAMVRAIIGMANALEISIVAEGVETAQQSAWLREEGCHLHQGYLFAKPMPVAALATFLEATGSSRQ